MTMASGGAYDGWWNGGIRNTANFHNIVDGPESLQRAQPRGTFKLLFNAIY